MNLKKIVIGICVSFLCIHINAVAQTVTVTNTEITENQTKAVISYQINPADDDKIYTTQLFLSMDDGLTFQPLKSVSGDIGELKKIPISTQKVVWDIFKDVAELSGAIKFEIRLTTKSIPLPLKQVVFYNYSSSAPVGLTYTRFRKRGWYAGFKTNFTSDASNYDASELGITNYNGNGYWQIGSESKVVRLAITGGVVYKLKRKAFVFAGAGFGNRTLLWSYNTFKADDTADQSGFARVTQTSYTGVEIEAGYIYFLTPRVPISFGISTVNGGFWDFNVGLGFSFK